MQDREIREAESLYRVRNFGAENSAAFPGTSLGGQSFAALNALLAELDTHGSMQSLGHGEERTSTGAKKAARKELRRQMRIISDTAKTMRDISPDIVKTFRVPIKNGDAALINAARAFLIAATPLKAEFIKRELPESFLTDLSAAIEAFESASNSQNVSLSKRISATASLKDTLERGMQLKQTLNPIVRNKFRNDPAKLAAWESAIHVERVPRRNKAVEPTNPQST